VGGRGHLQASPTSACHSLGWNGKRASAIEQVGGASHAGQLGASSCRLDAPQDPGVLTIRTASSSGRLHTAALRVLAAIQVEQGAQSNKAMKLTSLSAAPGLGCTTGVDGGAASYPRRRGTAGTGSQLIAGVRWTQKRWSSGTD
jgi:hypothetical protein